MSVKVPINKKFVKKFKKMFSSESLSESQFIEKLANEGKTLAITETFTGNSAQLLSFTPPQAKTFYLICGRAHDSQANVTWNLSLDGVLFESFRFDGQEDQPIETKFSVVFPSTFTIDVTSAVGGIHRVNLFGYLENSKTISSRGTTNVNP